MDYFETGFAVHEASWHRKEQLLDVPPDLSNWREYAGLEWEPVKVPLYLPATVTVKGTTVERTRPGVTSRPSGTWILVRNDRLDLLDSPDEKQRDLAILNRSVTDEYQPIEHERDMTPLIEVLFDAAKAMGVEAEFTTAGSVRDGKAVYACLQLSKPIQVKGDPSLTLPYGVIMNGHQGMSCRGGLTMVRIVCANTYAMSDADLDEHGLDFRVMHTGDIQERLEQARKAIATWLDALDGYRERMDYLAELRVDDDLVADWLDEFLPLDEKRMTERQVNNRTRERAQFVRLWYGEENDGATIAGIEGTGYGLWQTTIEFMDHYVPYKRVDAYLRRTMLKPQPAKRMAADRIVELATSGAR